MLSAMIEATEVKRGNFAVVDVETTGGASAANRIIEIAVVRVEKGEIGRSFSSLVNPERDLPRWIQDLTGIGPEDLETAPLFSEISDRVRGYLDGAVFAAHNAPFDYGFVRREYERLGETFEMDRICTLQLARKKLQLPRNKLGDVTRALGVTIEDRHRALGDAMATAEVLLKLL